MFDLKCSHGGCSIPFVPTVVGAPQTNSRYSYDFSRRKDIVGAEDFG